MRDYANAEQAFATVMKRRPGNRSTTASLYMHGWSLFKQGRLEDGLQSFFGVLDLKLGAARATKPTSTRCTA